MEEPILACSGLAVGYGGRTVASGIGFAVAAGQCVCVVGENGAGKSTLLRTLLGLQPALAGEIRHEGRAVLAVTHDLHDGLADATHVLEIGPEPFFGTWADWMARRGSAGKGGAA